MHDVAVLVGHHLHFDVPGVLDESLDEHGLVAERFAGFSPGSWEGLTQLVQRASNVHALAAATHGGLDDHREANRLRSLENLFVAGTDDAGYGRHASCLHRLASCDLVAHDLDGFSRGPHELDARIRARLCERRVLREKAVAGMNGLCTGFECRLHDGVDLEVALACVSGAEAHCLIARLHVQCMLIGIGVDGNRVDAHRTQGFGDAHRDFASVGDQDLVEHGHHILNTP